MKGASNSQGPDTFRDWQQRELAAAQQNQFRDGQ
jgi:hypothetical protein